MTSITSLRLKYPSAEARIWYQVGKPWMFDGNIFFDEQGIPILKIALKRMLFDEALPDPFSVATQIFKSLINGVSKIQPPKNFRAIAKC
jgi:hypothetical protein